MILSWLLASLFAAAAQPAGTERRCGWLHDPTPADWRLPDRALPRL